MLSNMYNVGLKFSVNIMQHWLLAQQYFSTTSAYFLLSTGHDI